MGRIKRTRERFQFLWTILKKVDSDHGFLISSGITFNLLICPVPLILMLLAVVSAISTVTGRS